jgi:mannose-6-phosphate isomerase-like protein (cupin superfamily)
VKEDDMAEVIRKGWDERKWTPTGTPGLDYSGLRSHAGGGATFFLRFVAGAVGAPHTHPEGEELYVVSGDITVGGRRLGTGDYLYTPPNESHDATAHVETILLLNAPKLPVFL